MFFMSTNKVFSIQRLLEFHSVTILKLNFQIDIHFFCIQGFLEYSVIHISIPPIKELCSKIAPREVVVSLPWWCHTLVLRPPGYWGLFLNLISFSYWKNGQFQRNFMSNLKVLNFSNFTLWNLTFFRLSTLT